MVSKDLVAHNRTRQQIAEYIQADDVIFQDLDDLKAACIEAVEDTSEVEDFEGGVFCGKYITDVPEGYFEHLSALRKGKRAQRASVTNIKAGGDEGGVVTSSGPVNGVPGGDEENTLRDANIIKTPEYREDIRYVVVDIKVALRLLTNAFDSLYNIGSEFPAHEK